MAEDERTSPILRPKQHVIYSTDGPVPVEYLRIDTRLEPYFSLNTRIEDSGFDLIMAIQRSGIVQFNYIGNERIARRVAFNHCELRMDRANLTLLVEPLTEPKLQTVPYQEGSLSLSLVAGRPADRETRTLLFESRPPKLTAKEGLVLLSLANGDEVLETAVKLRITPHTVNTHYKNISNKLETSTKIQTLIVALSIGIITPAVLEPDYEISQAPQDLTPRELEVLQYLASGVPMNETRETLKISESTYWDHIRALINKFEAKSAIQVTVRALKAGFAFLPQPPIQVNS